ncbi:MAG: AAA family ATPase [Pirellulales bacterium]|nr:AAA family ATPase [Pirellulales bacterium]
MYISRIVVRNFRNFVHLDVPLRKGVTCVIGENNTGKSNLLRAIRLAVDANYSSQYRQLLAHDVHSEADFTKPNHVVVSVEFTDYQNDVSEAALLQACEVAPGLARIHYRYRPRREIREDIESNEHDGTDLSLVDDYHFELTGGGANDPAGVQWDEALGSALRFGDLQAFQVEFLPALRDVTHSLRQAYESPLGRILNSSEISDDEREALVEILRNANQSIEGQPTISQTGIGIRDSFAIASGEAFQMDLKLGMAEPSFSSIARSLKVLLSNDSLSDFEPARNGLGLNNVLYISMLLKYFEHRAASEKSAGQLLLIEEPEAHLHPQLQRVLYDALASRPFQAILTTHSTHITSRAPVESFVALTNDGTAATSGCVPEHAGQLTGREAADLNRYLDATRSTLLYARKVLLVEGPAELFLIPVLARHVLNIDFDRLGISVVPIYGTHFGVYTKLFGDHALAKKCAVVCDGDSNPSQLADGLDEDSPLEDINVDIVETELVRVFQCPVTFERAMTISGTLPMLLEALKECEYPEAVKQVTDAIGTLADDGISEEVKCGELFELRTKILGSAKRCGKARFAQIASKYAHLADSIPDYIECAIDWLQDNEADK